MEIFRFICKRTLWSLVALVGLSIIIFTLSRVVPGDPARMALGPRATEEAVEALRIELKLDQPIIYQYFHWIASVLKGDFGLSLMTMRSVTDDIKIYLPATLELVIVAAIIQCVFGILLGVLATASQGSYMDYFLRIVAYIGVVTPSFVFAVLFMLLFGYKWPILPVLGRTSVGLGVQPITGMIVVDSILRCDFPVAVDAFVHLLLPATALAMNGMAQLARITRSSMIDNGERDYIVMETAQGLSKREIFFKYLLRPSVIPAVSVLALQIGALFANAFLVESIFNWPGLSRYGVEAMLFKDLNAVSAVICIVGFVFIIANIFVDILVAIIDPRVRLKAGE